MIKSWLSILARLEVPPLEKNSVLWIESIVQNFETETGIILPEGYKEFCRVFGAGGFGTYVTIDYPLVEPAKQYINLLKDRLQSRLRIGALLDVENLEDLLNSALTFGTTDDNEYLLWDLRTYDRSDKSYDIYLQRFSDR